MGHVGVGRFLIAGLLAATVVVGGGTSAVPAQAAADPKPPSACPPGERPPEYPPGRCRLLVQPTSVAPGGTVQVAGCGFHPGSGVKVTATPPEGNGRVRLGRPLADTTGCIGGALTIPSRTEAGTYVATATGKDPERDAYELVSGPIAVTATARPTEVIDADNAASSRPGRPSPAGPVAVLGLVLLGGVVVTGLRRRPGT